MPRHHQLAQLVEKSYLNSNQEFGRWMWHNHLQFVAHKAEELAQRFNANEDLAVAGAWLHDFGDAFVDRFSPEHEEVSTTEAKKVLHQANYTDSEIQEILDVIIAPHSCKNGLLPQTLEGKVLATADALAHFQTDFYLQFTWMHLPQGKTYPEFIEWVNEKLERDYTIKIFFEAVRAEVKDRYLALKEVFLTPARQ